jgi:hypothetical protein
VTLWNAANTTQITSGFAGASGSQPFNPSTGVNRIATSNPGNQINCSLVFGGAGLPTTSGTYIMRVNALGKTTLLTLNVQP